MSSQRSSRETLARIVELRQKGESYASIGRDKLVDLDRRTAKKLYEEWEREQSVNETRETRLQLKRGLMAEHAHELVTFGRALARALGIPQLDDERGGEEVVRGFLRSYTRARDSQSLPALDRDDRKLLERRNERLYRDLRMHTASTELWKLVRDYEVARDSWLDGRIELEERAEMLLKDGMRNEGQISGSLAQKRGLVRRLAMGLSLAYITAVVHSADTDPLPSAFNELDLSDQEAVRHSSKCYLRNDRIQVEFTVENQVVTIEGADEDVYTIVCKVLDNAARTLVDGPGASNLAAKLGQPVVTMMRCHDYLLAALHVSSFESLVLDTRCDHCPM